MYSYLYCIYKVQNCNQFYLLNRVETKLKLIVHAIFDELRDLHLK